MQLRFPCQYANSPIFLGTMCLDKQNQENHDKSYINQCDDMHLYPSLDNARIISVFRRALLLNYRGITNFHMLK